ncbi:MAG TPA: glycosyltransferase [Candidatus Krumholzibacteria bacterium]|nr:glycosyltransferase [Candidatus Krumholzibacteria bacterium]HPD71315.1 glycosyltransferase [Candidatus Krumholzibacteria bacterium]HRY38985.1 glycosyltransferase [Candidatus Krumholzibacteria bacterium]
MIYVIALLDKSDPPEHSFVDGFLSTVLVEEADIRVRLVVSRAGRDGGRPRRYRRAVCLPRLWRRRSLGRLANVLQAIRLVAPQVGRLRARQQTVVLLVRNCPILLLAAAVMRPRVDRLVYQSSFPHETASGSRLLRWGARLLLRACAPRVDAVLAVSPLGLARTRRLFPRAGTAAYIPLVADVPAALAPAPVAGTGTVRFVYVGSHEAKRGVDLVLRAAAAALARGLDAVFRSIGCTEAEYRRLAADPILRPWLDRGRIQLVHRIPRDAVWRELAAAEVGLSVIPPLPEFREASPTKLAEYLGAGLAVVASRGIPAQEDLVADSGAGLMVDWDADAIAGALARIAADRDALARRREAAIRHARTYLDPRAHLANLRRVLAGTGAGADPREVAPGSNAAATAASSGIRGDDDA